MIHPLFFYPLKCPIPEVSWNKEGLPYETFRYYETKILTKNRDTPPFLFSIKISEVFWNKGGFPYEIFRYCETKTLTKKRDKLALLLSQTICETRNFLKHRRVQIRNFWTLWDKKFVAENSDIPFLCVIFFRYLTFFETEKGSPTKFFGTVRQKNWQKLVKQTLFFYPLKFSKPENFLKHRVVLLRNVSVRWDKTVSTNRDTRPLSYP